MTPRRMPNKKPKARSREFNVLVRTKLAMARVKKERMIRLTMKIAAPVAMSATSFQAIMSRANGLIKG